MKDFNKLNKENLRLIIQSEKYFQLQNEFDSLNLHNLDVIKKTFSVLDNTLTSLSKVTIICFFSTNKNYPLVSNLFIDEFASSENNSFKLKLNHLLISQAKFKIELQNNKVNNFNLINNTIDSYKSQNEFYDEFLGLVLMNLHVFLYNEVKENLRKKSYSAKLTLYKKYIENTKLNNKKYFYELINTFDYKNRNFFTHKHYEIDLENSEILIQKENFQDTINFETLINKVIMNYGEILSYFVSISTLSVIANQKDISIIPDNYLSFCKSIYLEYN